MSAIQFSLDRKFDSLSMRASQGAIERDGDMILLTADSSGIDTVFVSFFLKRHFILRDTLKFDIIKPEIFPSFGGDLIGDRRISLKKIKAIGGVLFNIRLTDNHWEGSGLTSYRFSILRRDSVVFSTIETTPRFSDGLNLRIGDLVSGDIILISEAKISPKYDKICNVVPGIFIIE